MSEFKVGDVCIWQNCSGPWAYLNGQETTITGKPERGFHPFTLEMGPLAYPTDTPNPIAQGVLLAESHELRKKHPPASTDEAAHLAMLDCIERARRGQEISA